jgi:hypothetical protein
MKTVLAVMVLLAPVSVWAGRWDVGGKVSVLQDGEGVGLKTVITAEYLIAAALSWRTDLELQVLEVGDESNIDIALPSNLLWYPFAHRANIDPYIGPGLSYTFTHDQQSWLGANVLAGLTFLSIKDKKFGVEVKYNVANVFAWTDSDNIEIGLTGKWEFELGK